MSNQIWKELLHIRMERSAKQQELMESYDSTVYLPQLKALQERCAALGHSKELRYHNNGLGHTFLYCQDCDARVKTLPED